MSRVESGPQRLVRLARRRLLTNTRQQFRQHCDTVVSAAFHQAKQRYGAPRLTEELRAQG
ncbi:transposase [Morganella morganii]|uniref:transposase n=1 Tax=Morganella morganii TaxID=582 RepID=UPI001FFCD6A3|nr:transposase [Morganella morganii]